MFNYQHIYIQFKQIVVSIPLIWFCAIGISVVFTGKNFSQNEPSVKTEVSTNIP